jgi:hypothetical protein
MLTNDVVSFPEKDRHLSHGLYNCIVVQPPMTELARGQDV